MITNTQALTALARMMGKRTLPQGDNSDWVDYVQEAFNYAWRYYKWTFSLKTVDIDLTTNTHLPADFDLEGYREAIPDANGAITELPLGEYAAQPSGHRTFAIQWDSATNTYQLLTKSGLSSITLVYQVVPPTLATKTEDGVEVGVPFPSAMAIGLGASIWAKQGENPTRADVSQEWDMFHDELDRHVGRADANKPRQTNLNLQDAFGTYTGDVDY